VTVGFPLFLVVVAVAAVLLLRRADPARRALILRRAGFVVMAVSTVFFGLFAVGETFADPGGWKALGLVCAWLVPLLGLLALAWFRQDWAIRVFALLIAALIGVSIWFALDPQGWRSFEDRNGPIRSLVTFVVAAAVTLLGLKRTAASGLMLLVLSVVPLAVTSLGGRFGFASLIVATSAPFITAVLYLLSTVMAGRSETQRAAGTGPEGRLRGT
jgi:hypothetical protein